MITTMKKPSKVAKLESYREELRQELRHVERNISKYGAKMMHGITARIKELDAEIWDLMNQSALELWEGRAR